MYGDSINDGATAIGGLAKHHIVSQNIAPSQSVFTEKKTGGLTKGSVGIAGVVSKNGKHVTSHKKNQSISGGNSNDIFNGNYKTKQTIDHSNLSKNFNNSVTSNLSANLNKATKK